MAGLPPLGIIAGAGMMPLLVANAARAGGRQCCIIGLEGIADADFSGNVVHRLRLGAAATILGTLAEAGCQQVILTGKVVRPSVASLRPDLLAARLLPVLLGSGDASALDHITAVFEEHGMAITGLETVLPEGFADQGVMTGRKPSSAMMAGVKAGTRILAALGAHDVGQAVVIQGSRVLALEAAEGTDAMIRRGAELADPSLAPPILVKMMKTAQDRRLDPPVIGTKTIDQAAAAGIRLIAIQHGGVFMAEKQAVLVAARKQRLTLIGV